MIPFCPTSWEWLESTASRPPQTESKCCRGGRSEIHDNDDPGHQPGGRKPGLIHGALAVGVPPSSHTVVSSGPGPIEVHDQHDAGASRRAATAQEPVATAEQLVAAVERPTT